MVEDLCSFVSDLRRSALSHPFPQVAVLFVADLLNSVFNMVWIYDALINNFGMSSMCRIPPQY